MRSGQWPDTPSTAARFPKAPKILGKISLVVLSSGAILRSVDHLGRDLFETGAAQYARRPVPANPKRKELHPIERPVGTPGKMTGGGAAILRACVERSRAAGATRPTAREGEDADVQTVNNSAGSRHG